MTQTEVNTYLGLGRGVYPTYESGTTPKLPVLLRLLMMYRETMPIELSVEILYSEDLSLLKHLKKESGQTIARTSEQGPALDGEEEVGPANNNDEEAAESALKMPVITGTTNPLETILNSSAETRSEFLSAYAKEMARLTVNPANKDKHSEQ